jgi:hypothetical protein
MSRRIPPRKFSAESISVSERYAILDPSKPPQSTEPLTPENRRFIEGLRSVVEAYPEVAPAAVPAPAPAAKRAESAQPSSPAPLPLPTRAVWIVHGMGQQVQFETLDSLAEGVMSVTTPADGGTDFKPRFSAVKIGDSVVERVELDVCFQEEGQPDASKKSLCLHLYEAYWAPITEGQVKLADVISFLFDGSMRGILNCGKSFQRALFGQVAPFRIPFRNALEVTLALLTVLALIVLNAVILSAGAVHYGLAGLKLPATETNWSALTAIAGALIVVPLAFGALLFLAGLSKPASLPSPGQFLLSALSWIAFAFTLFVIIFGASRLGSASIFQSDSLARFNGLASTVQAWTTFTALLVGFLVLLALIARGWSRSNQSDLHGGFAFFLFFVLSFALFLLSCVWFIVILIPSLTPWLASLGQGFLPTPFFQFLKNPLWVWPLLLVLSWQVRELLIQYPGDVAAYVTPNKLDRFCEIRQKIKDLAYASASNVYLAQNPDGSLVYDKIAIIGHSLGSVIAYDTLNKLIIQDKLALTKFDVVGRTCLLETFGSPLDKTAFFFTVQGKDMFQVREQLAASVQPLITDPAARTIPWINVYSPNDIVSGHLKFYDLPKDFIADLRKQGREAEAKQLATMMKDVKEIDRLADPNAVIPLVAHVEYWQNHLIWTKLLEAL